MQFSGRRLISPTENPLGGVGSLMDVEFAGSEIQEMIKTYAHLATLTPVGKRPQVRRSNLNCTSFCEFRPARYWGADIPAGVKPAWTVTRREIWCRGPVHNYLRDEDSSR